MRLQAMASDTAGSYLYLRSVRSVQRQALHLFDGMAWRCHGGAGGCRPEKQRVKP